MVRNTVDCILEETIPLPIVEVLEKTALSEAVVVPNPPLKISKASIRTSLRASTLDGVFATIFSNATANLLMLMMWGKLADRIGNRPILIFIGILAAVMPLFWLGTETNSASVWVWLPLVHVFSGGTWAAIDLCSNNIQMSVAPIRSQSGYFAIAAAITGVTGAMGTATGGFLAQLSSLGGLPGLFALSAVLRLAALLPLVFYRSNALSR